MVLGFSASPFATFVLANRHEGVTLGRVAPYALATASACLVLIAIAWAVRGRPAADRFAVVLASALLVFFNYPAVSAPLMELGLRTRYQLLGWFTLLVAAAALGWWAARWRAVRQWALLFAVLLAAIPLSQLARHQMAGSTATAADAQSLVAGLERTPDIYVVVPDAYAGARVLESHFDFDNSEFVRALERRGFVVADDAYSNYSTTFLSVPSLLQMDYLVTAEPGSLPLEPGSDAIDRTEFYDILRGGSALMATLSDAGYLHIQAPPGTWGGSRCSGQEDVCIDPIVLADSPGLLLGDVEWALLELTPVATLLEAGLGETFDGVSSDPPHVAREVQRLDLDAPAFVFLHMLHPHPPFRFDPRCGPIDQTGGRDLTRWDEDAIDAYVAGVRCTNRRLEAMLEILPRDAVVVIQADHGPNFLGGAGLPAEDWTDEQIEERLSIISALRLPEECRSLVPEAGVAGVNTFRIVLACLSGEEPELLDDRHFLGGYHSSGIRETDRPGRGGR